MELARGCIRSVYESERVYQERKRVQQRCWASYRGTSLMRNRFPLESYSEPKPRALWWSYGGGLFLMSEVPLQRLPSRRRMHGGVTLLSHASLAGLS